MELRGTVRIDAPLLVVALSEEADAFDDALPVLVTGPGKVNAATSVAAALTSTRPASVVNVGTAGGLRDGLNGIHEINTVMQHDFDAAAFRALVGRDYGDPIELGIGNASSRIVLATGDTFVTDSVLRAQLAADAHLVDMEGYAVAWAARAAGVPVRLVKLVSDDADDSALRTWTETVGEHSHALAQWVRGEFGQAFSNR